MAGNSSSLFIGRNKRTLFLPSIDFTTVIDTSSSNSAYYNTFYVINRYSELETNLKNLGIGAFPSRVNKYSFCIGSTVGTALSAIERNVVINGSLFTRWATGDNFQNDTVALGNLSINSQDGIINSANLVSGTDRGYDTNAIRVVFGISNDITANTTQTFNTTDLFPYKYVGLHSLTFSYIAGQDQGPNPVPAGTWVGFFYETNTLGTAIYINGTVINYRKEVPIASVGVGGLTIASQRCVTRAINTNGALYISEQFNSAARATQLFESFSEIIKDNLTLV